MNYSSRKSGFENGNMYSETALIASYDKTPDGIQFYKSIFESRGYMKRNKHKFSMLKR